jgi:hypothetical protein
MNTLVWDLDGMAGHCYVGMVEHFEKCSTCKTAGAELAPNPSRPCPSGRRPRAAWEAAQVRSAAARGGLRV